VDHRPGWPKSQLSESGYAKIVIFVFAQAHNRHGIGQIIANHMWANRKDYGIWYVIWNRRIASQARPSRGWIPYTRLIAAGMLIAAGGRNGGCPTSSSQSRAVQGEYVRILC
jgi:hypothetical protein